MFVKEVIDALQMEKVEFAIVGGMAMAFHGMTRATMDVDILIRVHEKALSKTEAALKSIGLHSRIPVNARDIAAFRDEWLEKRNLIAWSFVDWTAPSRAVDVMIKYDLASFTVDNVKWGGLSVPVISLDGLLAMKKEAGRAQDKADVEKIEKKIAENRGR